MAEIVDSHFTKMSPFLKTPLEIRNQIYGYLLSTKYTKIDFLDEKPVSDDVLSALAVQLEER